TVEGSTYGAGSLLPAHCARASHAAMGDDERTGAARAQVAVCPGVVEIRRGASVADGVGQPDHGQGGGAAGTDPREPGYSRAVGDHELALRRMATDSSRRNRP